MLSRVSRSRVKFRIFLKIDCFAVLFFGGILLLNKAAVTRVHRYIEHLCRDGKLYIRLKIINARRNDP